MAQLPGLPFKGKRVTRGVLRVRGDDLDATLQTLAREKGWHKENGGPRWLHPDGGILPLL
jgi:hypothetical protein